MNVSDIEDKERKYRGLVFVPNVSANFIQSGQSTTTRDAANCQRVGNKCYGTIFEVAGYRSINHLVPMVFSTQLRSKVLNRGSKLFEQLKYLNGFDVDTRTTIVDQ